jgi:hypothetical protein
MYPYPPRPLDVPNFHGANGGTARENIKLQHALEVKRYTDVQNMNTVLIDTFLESKPVSAKIAYNKSASPTQMQSSVKCFNGF